MKQKSLNRHLHVLLFNAPSSSSSGCGEAMVLVFLGVDSSPVAGVASSTPITAKKRLVDCVLGIDWVVRLRFG